MAQASTLRFSEFLVLLGDGASPQQFVAPCGLTSRNFSRTAETNDTNVPDCDDEDAPSWLQRDTVSLQWSITGEGVLAKESQEEWEDWWETQETRDVRVVAGDMTWQGSGKLTSLEVQGERGSRVTVSVTITGDGKIERLASGA